MESRRVGGSGLRVSSVGLGTMTWGRDTDAHEAADQLREFLDAGGTLLDTAATYSDGAAEEVIGELLTDQVHRLDVVLCSKAGVRDGRVDASRGALLDALDSSLARLGTDHLDLWLVQAPDTRTPLAETLCTLEHPTATGRTQYVVLANHAPWPLANRATPTTCGLALATALPQ